MKQKRVLGDIIKINFDSQFHTYARILVESNYAFYDCKSINDIMDLNEIINKPILFICTCMNEAVEKGRWKVIGNIPLDATLKNVNPLTFKESILPKGSPKAYEIYENGYFRPASREECKGLEYAFVWGAEHIEERLRDHYAGRPNFQSEY